jgi:hypothetical protein
MKPVHHSAFLLLALALALAAQDPRGTILGQVSDTSGAGVAVRVTNLETNVTVKATSNPQGNYEVRYLLPGTYSIVAELAGFKTWTQPKVELRMGARRRGHPRSRPGGCRSTAAADQREETACSSPGACSADADQ